jgi:hypothetical protein
MTKLETNNIDWKKTNQVNNEFEKQQLLEKIKDNFLVNNDTAKKLSELKYLNTSIIDRQKLKEEINNLNITKEEKEKLKDLNKIQELFTKYNNEKNLLKNNTKENIKNILPSNKEYIIYNTSKLEKYLTHIYSKAKNPKNIFENITFWILWWALNSSEKILQTSLKIWKDIIKLPYDIFQLIKWKIKIIIKKI